MNRKVQALILGIMCVILTMAICVQIKTVKNNGTTLGRTEKETQLKDQVLKIRNEFLQLSNIGLLHFYSYIYFKPFIHLNIKV